MRAAKAARRDRRELDQPGRIRLRRQPTGRTNDPTADTYKIADWRRKIFRRRRSIRSWKRADILAGETYEAVYGPAPDFKPATSRS
jgi:hypothetical protein